MSANFYLISAGAAEGYTAQLRAPIAALGIALQGSFGAVGLMQTKLLEGAPCDAFISTAAILRDLAGQGRIDAASIRTLGSVATGISVKSAAAVPNVADAAGLRAALLAAAEIHCPDTERSTAGIHFAKVLRALGVADELAPRLRLHSNGMTAMRAVAASDQPMAMGCTQITEILATPGVQYAGDLPGDLGLQTVYGAGVVSGGVNAGLASAFVALLCGAEHADTRRSCGFV